MRLAVIADIHGNLPALEAVLADVAERGADRMVNLGDCVSGPLWPRETMDLLEACSLASVRGNHDRWLTETLRDAMSASDAFAFDRLTPAQVEVLGALPARIDLGGGMVGVHGTPSNDNAYLLEEVVDGRLMPAEPLAIRQRWAPCTPTSCFAPTPTSRGWFRPAVGCRCSTLVRSDARATSTRRRRPTCRRPAARMRAMPC
jgi:3',5'-cyclic AMP phosphodiesterase CpdA